MIERIARQLTLTLLLLEWHNHEAGSSYGNASLSILPVEAWSLMPRIGLRGRAKRAKGPSSISISVKAARLGYAVVLLTVITYLGLNSHSQGN